MDIACPNCAATYRVPDQLVFSRKPVRCAACGTRWVPDLPEGASPAPPASEVAPPAAEAPPAPGSIGATPQPEPGAAPSPEPSPGPAEMPTADGILTPGPAASPRLAEPRGAPGHPHRARGGALLPLAWAGSVLALGMILSGLFLYREAIAAAWPPFGWVARLLGG